MSVNIRCPKCGSTHVQLSNEEHVHHGFLWWCLIGWWWWIFEVIIKLSIGLFLLFFVDWWVAIIKAIAKKGYTWKCVRWFTNRRRIYYCHDCGTNFKG